MFDSLDEEAAAATRQLAGKTIRLVWRHRPGELLLEFADGTRLTVQATDSALELSITDGPQPVARL